MSVRNLDALLKPSSVVLVGASERAGSLGRLLLENLLAAGLQGPVYALNPHYESLLGVACYPDVAALPEAPELAVIVTPPESIPDTVAALGARGTRAAVVISAGFNGADNTALRERLLAAARPGLVRVMGPNCLGVMAPGAGLDASFAHLQPRSGGIAFIAQSGAMITSILDWAAPRDIGFSVLASLGDMIDVDFGDMLDYLADDRDTRAILMYVEAVTHARKFMSAARAAARSKPVIVVKAGRHAAAARAAASHTGALAGSDAVYDAAFRRAGMLRVLTLEELFDAAQTLALGHRPRGPRLAILTNGGGIGVLATDALVDHGGTLAELSPATFAKLDAVLPATWSRGNPVDIIGDAPPERYAAAVEALIGEPDADALLVLNCPTAVTSPDAAAAAVVDALPVRGERVGFTLGVPGPARFGLRRQGARAWLAGPDGDLLAVDELAMAGLHNVANALAAAAMARALGVDDASVARVLRTFRGLPHRAENAGTVDGVRYINDSKATNPGAAIASIEGLLGDRDGVLIAGGEAKGATFEAFAEVVARRAHTVVLIGRAARDIELALAGRCDCVFATDMPAAVQAARRAARAGDTVLLSPACASLDMFANYAERGAIFVAAVAALEGS